jgi:hypothetical protein
MSERPILFSGLMVRAILEGRKTMTRRVVKVPRWALAGQMECDGCEPNWPMAEDCYGDSQKIKCPYGVPGDKLWVRETWAVAKPWDYVKPKDLAKENDEYSRLAVDYKAEKQRMWGNTGTCGKTRPSIYMPRWASRITLEVTAVRVERLKEISEEDAEAEGVNLAAHKATLGMSSSAGNNRGAFVALWDSINAERGFGWDVNPWVWVVEFKRIGGAQ